MKTITCIDVEGNTYEVPASKLRWRPSAYGVVINDGHILLSKQFGDCCDLPGGGVGLGESPESAVIREVKEETGIDVKSPKLLGVKNSYFQAAHSNNKSYQSLLLYFVCEYVGGELSTDGFDGEEKTYAELAEWIPLESIDEIKPASTVDYRPFIRKALKT